MNPTVIFGDMPQFTVDRRTVEQSALKQVHTYSFASAAKQVMTEDTAKPKKSIVKMSMDEDTKRKIGQDKRKEDLQDWLDKLQHRLDEACIGEPSSPDVPKGKQNRRAVATLQLPDVAADKEEAKNAEPASTTSKKGIGKGRWKSVANLSEAALEFVTESDYVERLQGKKPAKESISSVCETLLEKKIKDKSKGGEAKAKTGKKKKTEKKEDTITDGADLDINSSKSGKDNKGRWKSVTNLSDTTVEFLTNSDYLDKLQGKMQKDCVFNLYERLNSRKAEDFSQQMPPPPSRPKAETHKSKKKTTKSKKEKKEPAPAAKTEPKPTAEAQNGK